MNIECLKRFAIDLRKIGIEAVARETKGFIIINIGNMDFYFYKTPNKQYDGWGTGSQEIMKDLGFTTPHEN